MWMAPNPFRRAALLRNIIESYLPRAGWVNFFFLPEVINREWAGRGLLAWAHTHLVTPLRRRSADPAAAAACVPVTLQVLLMHDVVCFAISGGEHWVRMQSWL